MFADVIQQAGDSGFPLRARFDPADEAEIAERLQRGVDLYRGFGRIIESGTDGVFQLGAGEGSDEIAEPAARAGIAAAAAEIERFYAMTRRGPAARIASWRRWRGVSGAECCGIGNWNRCWERTALAAPPTPERG